MEYEPQTSSWLPGSTNSFKTPSDDHNSSKKSRKKIKMAVVYCTKCKSMIKEKHLFRIGDHFWHKSCVLCDNCTGQLDDNAYLIDEKLLCHGCYYKSIHAPKCCGCQRLMLSNDYAMYSLNNPYHLSCFKCCICGNLISKGDRYIVSNGRLICKSDYDASRYQQQQQTQPSATAALSSLTSQTMRPQQHPSTQPHTVNPVKLNQSDNNASNMISQTSGSVRKKTKISSEQRLFLEKYYTKVSNPSIKQRESIAQELNLPAKVIQTWFCNYRTKLKMQRGNGVRGSYDCMNSEDRESNSSSRMKSILQEQCLTPDQDFPTTNCQISQSTEDHASPQDLSSDLSAGPYSAQQQQHHSQHKMPQQFGSSSEVASSGATEAGFTLTDLSNSCAKSLHHSSLLNAASSTATSSTSGLCHSMPSPAALIPHHLSSVAGGSSNPHTPTGQSALPNNMTVSE